MATHHADGSVTLDAIEFKAVEQVLEAYSDAVYGLVNDGDFVGWENFRAMSIIQEQMGDHDPTQDAEWFTGNESDSGVSLHDWLASYVRNQEGGDHVC